MNKEDILLSYCKCWFCCHDAGEMVYDSEFDTYLHLDCLKKALSKDPEDPEAKFMSYLLDK